MDGSGIKEEELMGRMEDEGEHVCEVWCRRFVCGGPITVFLLGGSELLCGS